MGQSTLKNGDPKERMTTTITSNDGALLPRIEGRIQLVRGLRVMVDVDLAALYGVPTKRLNEQVKRNRDRFPPDFLFQLTPAEKAEVVANCDHLQKLKFSKVLPLCLHRAWRDPGGQCAGIKPGARSAQATHRLCHARGTQEGQARRHEAVGLFPLGG